MAEESKGIENLNKEMNEFVKPQAPEAQAAQKKPAPAKGRKKAAKKQKVTIARGKRKRAIARARLMAGSGRLTINGREIGSLEPAEIRNLILSPSELSSVTREMLKKSDIVITVRGGGVSGQAQAARSALAKALADSAPSDAVKHMLMSYDRSLLVDDYRRVEPKKFKGPKARARFQKSYR